MKKNKFFFILLTYVFTLNVFCSTVDFIKIQHAPYFIPGRDIELSLTVMFGGQQKTIVLKKSFCAPNRLNSYSSKHFYISAHDIFSVLLEHINLHDSNKKLEIIAHGQGENIEILPDHYYNMFYLYNRDRLFVKEKNNNE